MLTRKDFIKIAEALGQCTPNQDLRSVDLDEVIINLSTFFKQSSVGFKPDVFKDKVYSTIWSRTSREFNESSE